MKKLFVLLFAYVLFGLPIALIHWTLRVLGILSVSGWENFPTRPEKVLLISNHPSKNVQPFLLAGLFAHAYLLHPYRFGPRPAVDKHNFYDRLILRPIREWMMPVNRKNPKDDTCMLVAREYAKRGIPQMWFPEGTRTRKAKVHTYSPSGNRIGTLRLGFANITLRNNYSVLPVWYGRKGLKIQMNIGRPRRFINCDEKYVARRMTQVLLELSET